MAETDEHPGPEQTWHLPPLRVLYSKATLPRPQPPPSAKGGAAGRAGRDEAKKPGLLIGDSRRQEVGQLGEVLLMCAKCAPDLDGGARTEGPRMRNQGQTGDAPWNPRVEVVRTEKGKRR